jgi:hypothetical protein
MHIYIHTLIHIINIHVCVCVCVFQGGSHLVCVFGSKNVHVAVPFSNDKAEMVAYLAAQYASEDRYTLGVCVCVCVCVFMFVHWRLM